MATAHKVIWSEGMFLEPQHFQQHDRYLEQLIEARIGPAVGHGWGFVQLAIDEPALALGKLVLASASGVFPDGTPFDFPASHPAPLPLDVPPGTQDQLVLLALPLRRPGAGEADTGAPGEPGLARYALADIELADPATGGPARIQVGQLQPRLMLASEALDAYACLGVARLVERRADNTLVLDRGFIAPALRVADSPQLAAHAREVAGLLHGRGEELAALVGRPGPGGVGEVADFLLLQVVNRFEPLFLDYARTRLLHPRQLFLACLQLAGELSTFSRDNRRAPPYPDYLHDRLEQSFTPLLADLRRSLSMVLHRRALPIELQDRKFGVRVALLPDRELLVNAQFVLAAAAQMTPELLRSRFPSQVKIGPVERIRDLVNLQLPGIALRPMAVAPRQIPFHAGHTYFELEAGSELWKALEHSSGIAMHIAGDFPGLQLEFWAIKGAA
ncbi:MAG: type VI secretion system baseplate subunit TssK [Telluria sp.]